MGIDPIGLIIYLFVLIYSAILHEIAHGLVADRLGDPTARLMGRLTLNPISHIDPVYTILFPLLTYISSGGTVIFGGAKPVPVDPFNLREGRKDLALVSLAGPLTNILLAVTAAFLLRTLFVFNFGDVSILIATILKAIIRINILLAIFNLLPIPPLDGSKIFSLILPEREAAAYLSLGQIGIFLLLILLAFPIGGFSLELIINNLYQLALHLLGL